jgi:hypothetical protein
MNEREMLKELIMNGYAFEYGRIAICCINDYYNGRLKGVQFSVHTDHHKAGDESSELFDDLNKAVDRFLKLKGICYGCKS